MAVERAKELRRRRNRRNKIRKLKIKMIRAKDNQEKEKILVKLEKISPFLVSQAQHQSKKTAESSEA